MDRARARNRCRHWHATLDRVALSVPPVAQPLADTLRTALAHMLITSRRPRAAPGHARVRALVDSRRRDDVGERCCGSVTPMRRAEYFDWYAPHQFAERQGARAASMRAAPIRCPRTTAPASSYFSPIEIYRYTGDRAALECAWPHVDAAVRYMDSLRASERVAATATTRAARFVACCPRRSATKATRPSRCIRTGTTSGR